MNTKLALDELPEWQLGWLAGFIDGEGTIGIYKHRNEEVQLQVRVSSIDVGVMNIIADITHLGHITDVVSSNPKAKLLRCWALTAAADIYLLLVKLLPYLLIKRPQAEMMIEYCRGKLSDTPSHNADYYFARTKQLNKREG